MKTSTGTFPASTLFSSYKLRRPRCIKAPTNFKMLNQSISPASYGCTETNRIDGAALDSAIERQNYPTDWKLWTSWRPWGTALTKWQSNPRHQKILCSIRQLTKLEAAPHGRCETVPAHWHQITGVRPGSCLLHVWARRSLIVHNACPAIKAQ